MYMHSFLSLVRTSSIGILAVLASACQSTGGPGERLDERSGLTWAVADSPLSFARTEPRWSRSTRDYVYLGPVEVNNRGTREYFLWFGVATTLDRGFLAPELAAPEIVSFRIDDEPVELILEPWSERVPGLGHLSIYEPGVQPYLQLAARVTRDQLSMLIDSGISSLRIGGPETGMREFFHWNGDVVWPDFATVRSVN